MLWFLYTRLDPSNALPAQQTIKWFAYYPQTRVQNNQMLYLSVAKHLERSNVLLAVRRAQYSQRNVNINHNITL